MIEYVFRVTLLVRAARPTRLGLRSVLESRIGDLIALRGHVTSAVNLNANMAADQEQCPSGALYVEKKERLVAYLY